MEDKRIKISGNDVYVTDYIVEYDNFFELLLKYKKNYNLIFDNCTFNIISDSFHSANNQNYYVVNSIKYANCTFYNKEITNSIYLIKEVLFKNCRAECDIFFAFFKPVKPSKPVVFKVEKCNFLNLDFDYNVIDEFNNLLIRERSNEIYFSLDISKDTIIENDLSIINCQFYNLEIRDCEINGDVKIENNIVYNELSFIDNDIKSKKMSLDTNLVLNSLKINSIFNKIKSYNISSNIIVNNLDLTRLVIFNSEYEKINLNITNNNISDLFIISLVNNEIEFLANLILNLNEGRFEPEYFHEVVNYYYYSILHSDNLTEHINSYFMNKYSFLDENYSYRNIDNDDKEYLNQMIVEFVHKLSYFNYKLLNLEPKYTLILRSASIENCDIHLDYSEFSALDIYRAKISFIDPITFNQAKNIIQANNNEEVSQSFQILSNIYRNRDLKLSNKFKEFSLDIKYNNRLKKFFSGYDVYPWKVLRFMLIIMVAFAIVYFFTGLNNTDYKKTYTLYRWSVATNIELWRAFYFSIVTFSTLGFGDLYPNKYSSFFAASEGLIGAFTIAYYIGIKINNRN
ncbi:potassium channel family protein [Haloplasma contractile]|uniref:Ion transport 2 domain-containing protein n=1 Tax=Haloplasma contractile SSD-17B TaxID=1033810 RepID=U2E7Q6_9MOLU|nr:potassium channel family protein [Haloplasma contractile]ERJ11233.1 Ion transport 2 domain-containing protein [Haloplasma contractile SSD-17B]